MDPKGVVFGHNVCQTGDAKWLCIEEIYQKFYRPNTYDIGGTNIEDVADYWFMFVTKQIGNIFLLELFVSSRQERSFNVAVSSTNELKFGNKNNCAFLDAPLKYYHIKREKDVTINFIKTYSFSDLDVELLSDKKLYIAVSLSNPHELQSVMDNIKYNHDFGSLLQDPIDADFTIESSEGEKFRVHKVILAAQSEVFKAMLKDETAESQNNSVKLIDVCKEDLQYILEFIYTGTVKDIGNGNCNLCNLLMLADRYNLKGLKDLAQKAFSIQIDCDNALETLVIGDLYNSDTLKIAALKFIKKNAHVLQNSIFDEINNTELVRELCRYLAT